MKRRIVDADGAATGQSTTPSFSVGPGIAFSPAVEKLAHPTGLSFYRYRLNSFPPNVEEHDSLNYFLGALISKLMVVTSARMQPFMCIDGRHLDDEFFAKLRQSGAAWRPLLGFPMVPGLQPFRYLPVAYQISSRDAWNDVAEQFLGTGGSAIYLTSLGTDEFLIRLVQLVFTRNNEGATDLVRIFLPEVVLTHLEKLTGPTLDRFAECFQVFIGERPSAAAVDILSVQNIDDVVRVVAEGVR